MFYGFQFIVFSLIFFFLKYRVFEGTRGHCFFKCSYYFNRLLSLSSSLWCLILKACLTNIFLYYVILNKGFIRWFPIVCVGYLYDEKQGRLKYCFLTNLKIVIYSLWSHYFIFIKTIFEDVWYEYVFLAFF